MPAAGAGGSGPLLTVRPVPAGRRRTGPLRGRPGRKRPN